MSRARLPPSLPGKAVEDALRRVDRWFMGDHVNAGAVVGRVWKELSLLAPGDADDAHLAELRRRIEQVRELAGRRWGSGPGTEEWGDVLTMLEGGWPSSREGVAQ